MTQHSRMIQDAQQNRDVLVTEIDEKVIREDLAKLEAKLKVPSAEIYVPKEEEILYTIGSQWKQRFIVKKDDTLFISPIQYNVETDRWVNYHENDWDNRPWLLKCGGCHVTGTNLEKQAFTEPGVACESCHGKGSWHAALPKTAVFEKRQTIVNPAKLPTGVASKSADPATIAARPKWKRAPVGRWDMNQARHCQNTTYRHLTKVEIKSTSIPTNFPRATTSSTLTGLSRRTLRRGSPVPHAIMCIRSASPRRGHRPRLLVRPSALSAMRW